MNVHDDGDVLDRWLARRELQKTVGSAVRLIEAAHGSSDAAQRRDAIRLGLSTLREVEERDPTALRRFGADLSEFNDLAREVGLAELEPLTTPLREGEDIERVRREWRSGDVHALRESDVNVMLAALPDLAEDAGIDPAALRPGSDAELVDSLGLYWDA